MSIVVHQSEIEDAGDASVTEEETEHADDESDEKESEADEELENLKKKPTRLLNALSKEVSIHPSSSV